MTGSRVVRLSGQSIDSGRRLRRHFDSMRIGLIGTGRIGTFHANTLSRHREVGLPDRHGRRPRRGPRARGPPRRDGRARRRRDLHLGRGRGGDHRRDLGPRRTDRPGSTLGAAGVLREAHRPGPAGHAGRAREVDAAGTVLQMGFQRRFDAGYTAAREAVRSGRLGRLHTVRAHHLRPGAAARRVPAAVRRPLPGLPDPRLRHPALGDRARGRRGVRGRVGRRARDVPRGGRRRHGGRGAHPGRRHARHGHGDPGERRRLRRADGAGRGAGPGRGRAWTTVRRSRPPEPTGPAAPRTSPGRASWSASAPPTRPSWPRSSGGARASGPTRATAARRSRPCGSPRPASCPGGSAARWRWRRSRRHRQRLAPLPASGLVTSACDKCVQR